MCALSACVFACAMCMPGTCRWHKKVIDSPRPGVTDDCEAPVGTENPAQFLQENIQCFWLMSHLSSPIQQDCIPCLLSVAVLLGLIILIWSGGCLLASAAAIYRPRKILQSWSLQMRPHYITLQALPTGWRNSVTPWDSRCSRCWKE